MSAALDNKQISTLSQLYAKQVQLKRDMEKLKNDTTVSLPFVGIAMPINLLGTFGGVLTLGLVMYIGHLLGRIAANLKRAYELEESPDRKYYEAVVAAIPFAQTTRFIATTSIVLILVTPGVIGGYLYAIQHHNSIFALVSVSVGIATYMASSILTAIQTNRLTQLKFMKS